jgi:hypothetical protein
VRDRVADQWLAELAGLSDVSGPGVAAQLVDMIDRGVLKIVAGGDGEVVVSLASGADVGAADADLLRILFAGGRTEVALRAHRFAAEAAALAKATRRRLRAIGWWRTRVSVPRLLAAGVGIPGVWALVSGLLALPLLPDWLSPLVSFLLLFPMVLGAPPMVWDWASAKVLSPAGQAAAAELRAYAAVHRSGPPGLLGDLVAFGQVDRWAERLEVAGPARTGVTALDRALVAESIQRIVNAFEYGTRTLVFDGAGGGGS